MCIRDSISLALGSYALSRLADDLYAIGYIKASERTIINWRNRTYKHVSYEAVLAVKLAHERRLLDRDIEDAKIQDIISDL